MNYLMNNCHKPLEVIDTALCDPVVNNAHGLYQLFLHLWHTFDVKPGQEVVSDSDEGVSRPALEPVHCAARDQAWELEGSSSELLSHLRIDGGHGIKFST